MSLTLSITTPQGIVLAADSRQSYRNNVGATRIGSDSAQKIFQLDEKTGVTIAGPAFLKDPDDPKSNPRSISYFIEEFLKEKSQKETVKSITEKLSSYLKDVYKPDEQIKLLEGQLKDKITQSGGKVVKVTQSKHKEAVIVDFVNKEGKTGKGVAGIIPMSLIVAGYNVEKVGYPELSLFTSYIPGPIKEVRNHGKPNEFGANWTGQKDVVMRIVLGRDPRMEALDFVKLAKKDVGEKKVRDQLNKLQYNINWGGMTLHDAIEFAKLMIETTSAIQKFSDGIGLSPGDIPGVGGPVDIAVILPKDGFHWHTRKELNLEKPNSN